MAAEEASGHAQLADMGSFETKSLKVLAELRSIINLREVGGGGGLGEVEADHGGGRKGG